MMATDPNSLIRRIFLTILFIVCMVNNGYTKQEYLIDTPKCKIPNYEPFHSDALKLWYPESYISCSSRPLLSYVTKTDQAATLHIKQYLLPLFGRNITCCVSDVFRKSDEQFPDDKIRLTECRYFNNQVLLNSDTIVVKCRNDRGYLVYRNAHSVVLKTPKIKEKLSQFPKNTRPISVLFVVVDSISRLNLIRTMPKTRDYLLGNDFIEMEGYSKIDDNTFPNFMAFLTGFNKHQIRKFKCTARNVRELDDCPMLWYKFRDLGYATAHGEDWGPLGTFNFNKKGFTTPPTDYYFRPYVLASESLGTYSLYGAPYCAGLETSGERQLNLALDFAQTFKNSPYFGIFWMNTFSHQAINAPMIFDDRMKEFFTDLKAEGVLNDSVVIYLSDHGIRMDPSMRTTLPGWFEERLPMNLISVPEWFRGKFPKEYTNLKLNSKKLTSTHDLYMTLQHILKLSTNNYNISDSRGCPKCRSFFEEIPLRSCREAGIPPEWCTCIGYLKPLNNSSDLVVRGVKFVTDHMQSVLNVLNVTNICENIEVAQVQSAGVSETSEVEDEKFLFLHFETSPYAEYIVTLKYRMKSIGDEPVLDILFDIVRIGGVSGCRYKIKLPTYCNCKNTE